MLMTSFADRPVRDFPISFTSQYLTCLLLTKQNNLAECFQRQDFSRPRPGSGGEILDNDLFGNLNTFSGSLNVIEPAFRTMTNDTQKLLLLRSAGTAAHSMPGTAPRYLSRPFVRATGPSRAPTGTSSFQSASPNPNGQFSRSP